MTQRQNDTVRHFGTEGQNGTATKWHGLQSDTVRHYETQDHFNTATKRHGESL